MRGHFIRLYVLIILSLLLTSSSRAQLSQTVEDKLLPVSPTTYQFTKYEDLPIGKYTGVADVTVPLYTIEQGDLTIPITVNYHTGGIKVNEEASWVGLGWNLPLGQIVQTVMDKDDLADVYYLAAQNSKGTSANPLWMQPDFIHGPFSVLYSYNHDACGTYMPATTPTYTPQTPIAAYGAATTLRYYMPYNGSMNNHYQYFFETHEYFDSEHDIFKANFLGNSINFIYDVVTDNFVSLNKKGYKIEFQQNAFTITIPTGQTFVFGQYTPVYTDNSDKNGCTIPPTYIKPTSKKWMVTKIVSLNKDTISFHYAQSDSLYRSFPQNSQSAVVQKSASSHGISYTTFTGYVSGSSTGMLFSCNIGVDTINPLTTITTFREPECHLTEIKSKFATVTFHASPRLDVNGGVRLDSLTIINQNQHIVDRFSFEYSYINSSTVKDHVISNGAYYNDTGRFSYLRMQLDQIKQNDSNWYQFDYNPVKLPHKNSCATDFWGFYNGALTNITLIPNPVRFPSKSSLGDSHNNHGADVVNTQAGILISITYPTGGKTKFTYELNTFTNYFAPDIDSLNNVTTKGEGLRTKSIDFYASGSTSPSKRTTYNYFGGINNSPKSFFRDEQLSVLKTGEIVDGKYMLYTYDQTVINGSQFLSSNPMGSHAGVGYSEVIQYNLDNVGNNIGAVDTYFNNSQDILVNAGITSGSAVIFSVPSFKSPEEPESGSIAKEDIRDSNQVLTKRTLNYYSNHSSPIYYSVMVGGYPALVDVNSSTGSQCSHYIINPHNLLVWYPVFDVETLPDSTIVYNYSLNDSLRMKETNIYESQYRLMRRNVYQDSKGASYSTVYYYPFDYSASNVVYAQMVNDNRVAEVVNTSDLKGDVTGHYEHSISKHFIAGNRPNSYLLASISERYGNIHPETTNATYDLYDGNNNLLQYTVAGTPTTLIWGYKGQYPVAQIKGVSFNEINLLIDTAAIYDKTDDDIATYLSQLRTQLQNKTDVFVKTFTYLPLVGLATETDEKGAVKKYKYDNFNRLSDILDKDNKVRMHNDYHYKKMD
ncbi:hypothetical protein GCM10027566_25480 [Arachidicoccus ginsenosidivorans]